MHSYIVSPFHFSQISMIHNSCFIIHPDGASIGIKQIRELIGSLSNTSPISRIVWIEPADSLTTEASNALLKVLEEPPHNTTFYLATNYPGTLLPTIRSRCQSISTTIREPASTTYLQTIKSALPLSLGDRLTLAQTIPTDRTEALGWCESLMHELHATIQKTTTTKSLQILSAIAKQLTNLSTQLSANVSTSLALGNFFLHLPKIANKI
jgi:DNA polymerase III gamma/tau subunit